MSMPQVGQGAVAVVPTFKGFRSAVNKETDASAKESTKGFRSAWSKEGASSGKATGTGFRKAFESSTDGFTDKATKQLEQNVAKASRVLSQARLKQQDQVGRVRVAERQLAEAQEKHARNSSQVLRATERLASETRKLETANEGTAAATNDLRDAQNRLATAADRAGDQLSESGRSGARRFSAGFREVFAGSFLGTTVANLASSLVSQIGYAIGTGLREAVQFAIGSVDIASDLNESVNAVTVAYGDIADEVLALGENSATAFGLSKRQLNQYAVQFSAFSKGIAGDGGDVAGTFESILGRATDFASVMNVDVAEALGLFQSGLAGETEPLRRYGIDLSAATVEAFAYANGIAAQGVELTEAQKQQARYMALLEQTSVVQGDFANTSDELANKNRINAATWDDLQAKIGTAFLPIASELASVLADDVLPAISDLVDEHGPELAKAFEDALPALSQLAEDVLPMLPELFESIGDVLPDVIQLTQKLLPVLIDLAEATNGYFSGVTALSNLLNGDISLEQYRDRLLELPGPFGDAARAVFEFGAGTRRNLDEAVSAVTTFASEVQTNIDRVITWFRELPGRIGEFFVGVGTWLLDSGRALIQGFIDGINEMFKPVGDAVSGVLSWAQGFFPSSPAKRGPFSGAGWSRLEQSGSAVMEQWTSGFARPELSGVLSPIHADAATTSTAPAGVSFPAQHVNETIQIVLPNGKVLFEYLRQYKRSGE